MVSVAEIGSLAPDVAAARLDRAHPQQAAVEFDALVLELLLRQSGLLHSLSAQADAQAPLMSEMFLQNIAHQLARQMDLGFGRLLTQEAGLTQGGKP